MTEKFYYPLTKLRLDIKLYNEKMYIREAITTKKGRKYKTLHLVETIQTEKGPRQRFILNLGNLKLEKKDQKLLSKRLKEILTGEELLIPQVSDKIERFAQIIAKRVSKKEAIPLLKPEAKEEKEEKKVEIYLDSIDPVDVRSIGIEYIGHEFWNRLNMNVILKELNFSERYIKLAEALVISKLVNPKSELATSLNLSKTSAIDELMGVDYTNLKEDVLYRVSDKLLKNKEEIEKRLNNAEVSLFNLEYKIILYDLTSTYFEGIGLKNEDAKYGHSRDKRRDCKQVVVGVVIDEKGFVKRHEVFTGNRTDAKTLEEMIKELDKNIQIGSKKPTIVIDRGIATEANIKYLKEKGYKYIVMVRGKEKERMSFELGENLMKMIEVEGRKMKVYRKENEEEVYLLCESEERKMKDKEIRDRFEKLYKESLEQLEGRIKKGKLKDKEKINKKIGYLNCKYPRVAKLFNIEIKGNKDKGFQLKWNINNEQKEKKVLVDGRYVLRTNQKELQDKDIISIYTMLSKVEKSFRYLKSELLIRPIYHQKKDRVRGHIFITILAYHLLHAIEEKLKLAGDKRDFASIKCDLQTHIRLTIAMKKTDNSMLYIRQNSAPEDWQVKIYKELGLSGRPIGRRYYSSIVTEKKYKPPN